MEMTEERRNEIAFIVLKNQFLRGAELRQFINLNENDIKKRIGHFVQETGVPKEEALEFVKRFVGEIHLTVKQVNDKVQQISFQK